MNKCCVCGKEYPSTYEEDCKCGGGLIEFESDNQVFMDWISEPGNFQ